MRNTFPSRTELLEMPLSRLRNLDVQERDEEELIQEIVTSKLKDLPLEGTIFRGDVPDIQTPEQESKWQEVIDGRTAEKKAKIVGQETEVAEEPIDVPADAPLEVPVDVSHEHQEPFGCDICHGKKGHKKACPNR